MAGNVRRFANLHSSAFVVPPYLPEPGVVLEAKDRRSYGRCTCSESRPSIGSSVLRGPYTHQAR